MSYSSAHFLVFFSTHIYYMLFALWQEDLYPSCRSITHHDGRRVYHTTHNHLKSFHPSALWHAHITLLSLFPLVPCTNSILILLSPVISPLFWSVSVPDFCPYLLSFSSWFCLHFSSSRCFSVFFLLRVPSHTLQMPRDLGLHLIVSFSFSHYDTHSPDLPSLPLLSTTEMDIFKLHIVRRIFAA